VRVEEQSEDPGRLTGVVVQKTQKQMLFLWFAK
jgi:hypothetical protein